MEAPEAEETARLRRVQEKLRAQLARLDGRVRRYSNELEEQKTYQWEHRGEMDHIEKIAARQATEQTMFSAEGTRAARERVEKLIASPYFGRIDFVRDGDGEPLDVYVGVHSFTDEETGDHLVFDWRAPISTMFYEHELGDARYESPAGPVHGKIELKRQFRIRFGELEFLIESGLNILDDVLQEELSRTSDDKMKNIVATIQRDQNRIIRNEDAPVLIIQGVAGSGKTSIALHRIAFLLYRFKDELSAEDILIISPNEVFGDFISNVLPELGEEPIAGLEMEHLARELLGHEFEIQTPFEQASLLLERGKKSEALRHRVEAKSSFEFLEAIEAYAKHVLKTRISPADVVVGRYIVPPGFVQRAFDRRQNLPLNEHIQWVVECVERELWVRHRHEVTSSQRGTIRSQLKRMCRNPKLKTLYKELFAWWERPELLKPAPRRRLEWADAFPMIYLKLLLEGTPKDHHQIKHLVVDEMQDYTPVQFAVLSKLFTCNKTILGDVNQAINSSVASSAEGIGRVFRQAEAVTLSTSYRSSYEITRFAQSISPDAELVAIERHGEPPRVIPCASADEELAALRRAVEDFAAGTHATMAIICKTQARAEQLHEGLVGALPDLHLLTEDSSSFVRGAVVCSVHMSKGLEFDRVAVPEVTREAYWTELDRNLLYVACTRAMHELWLTHVGAPSPLLQSP